MEIDLQVATAAAGVPSANQLSSWADAAVKYCACDDKALTVRITDDEESAELNKRYRDRQGPTNVLSFPFEDPPGVQAGILGDLVICAPVVQREAIEQGKTPEAHWAHILVHGLLHLCGYDHIEASDADIMESLETDIVTGLGFPPPYEQTLNNNETKT